MTNAPRPGPANRTSTRRVGGGYFVQANRWIDADYMAAAPGSVTRVYQFLNRWSDNESGQAAQPIRLIALKCGMSEKMARQSLRTLERWGCIVRQAEPGPSGTNVWILVDLAEAAPPFPSMDGSEDDQDPPGRNDPPGHFCPPVVLTLPNTTTPYQPKKTNLREREQPERDDAPDGASSHPGKEGRKGSRSKPLTVVPDPYEPTPEQVEWAVENAGLSRREIGVETLKFVAYYQANDRKMRDWNATWRGWMVRAAGYRTNDPGKKVKRATSGGTTPEGGKMW